MIDKPIIFPETFYTYIIEDGSDTIINPFHFKIKSYGNNTRDRWGLNKIEIDTSEKTLEKIRDTIFREGGIEKYLDQNGNMLGLTPKGRLPQRLFSEVAHIVDVPHYLIKIFLEKENNRYLKAKSIVNYVLGEVKPTNPRYSRINIIDENELTDDDWRNDDDDDDDWRNDDDDDWDGNDNNDLDGNDNDNFSRDSNKDINPHVDKNKAYQKKIKKTKEN